MKLRPHIYCLITISFFSTIEVVGKLIDYSITPYAITAWRFLAGGLLLLPFAVNELKKREDKLTGKDIGGFAISGILNVCISMLFLQLSIYYGKANLSAVIISSNPLFVMVFAAVFIKEKITRPHAIGLFVGLIGMLIFILTDTHGMGTVKNMNLGIIFGLSAAMTFALSTVYSKHLIHRHGNFITLSFAFICGAIALFLYSFLTHKVVLFHPNLHNLFWMLYLSVGVTGIAYILYFNAIQAIGAVHASAYFFLKPVIASLLAWFIHSEQLNLWQMLAIVLVMVSLSRHYFIKLMGRFTSFD